VNEQTTPAVPIETPKAKTLKDWDEFERSIIGNFLLIAYQPNPLRNNVEAIVDGENKLWIERERFIKMLKDVLDYSKPDSRDLINAVEVTLYRYGDWYYIDRSKMLVSSLDEVVPFEKLEVAKLREKVLENESSMDRTVRGVDQAALSRYDQLQRAAIPKPKRKKYNPAELVTWGRN